MALWSLIVTFLTDPGAVPMGAKPLYHPSYDSQVNEQYCRVEGINFSGDESSTNSEAENRSNASGRKSLASAHTRPISNLRRKNNNNGSGGVATTNSSDTDVQSSTVTPMQSGNTNRTNRLGIRRCRKCQDNFKPPRAHHDSVTGRCIVKMDHFCPWVCNAIGAMNHKHFVLFILYTFLSTIVGLTLIFLRLFRCGYMSADSSDDNSPSDADSNTTLFESIIVGGNAYYSRRSMQSFLYTQVDDDDNDQPECDNLMSADTTILFAATALFLCFTCCMLIDQFDAITTNTGKVARKKIRSGMATSDELGRVARNFNEMFGGNSTHPQWHWFFPLPVKFPDGMDAFVLQYRYDGPTDTHWKVSRASASGSGDGQDCAIGGGIMPISEKSLYDPPAPPKSIIAMKRRGVDSGGGIYSELGTDEYESDTSGIGSEISNIV